MVKKNKAGYPAAKSGNSTGNPPKNGRPHKDHDAGLFERLCKCMCTQAEIFAVMKAEARSIESWCQRKWGKSLQEMMEEFSQGGKASLRRTQLKLAQTNPTMAIWCGKQYLGQVDHDKNNDTTINDAAKQIINAANFLSQEYNAKSPKPEANREL